MRLQAGVASTFEAAGAADRIQLEIGNMFRDGSLAVLIAKYSYFGLDDTWASYEQIDAEGRRQWLIWLTIGLAFVAGAGAVAGQFLASAQACGSRASRE